MKLKRQQRYRRNLKDDMKSKIRDYDKNRKRVKRLQNSVRSSKSKTYEKQCNVMLEDSANNTLLKDATGDAVCRVKVLGELLNLEREDDEFRNQWLKQWPELVPAVEINDLHKEIRVILNFKKLRRMEEHARKVMNVRLKYGTYKRIASLTGYPIKSIHAILTPPKPKVNKRKQMAFLRRHELHAWWQQDLVSQPMPSIKHGSKRYSKRSQNEMFQLYERDHEFHYFGKMSKSTVNRYRPVHVKPMSQTPLDQCLCEKCQNIRLLLSAMRSYGLSMVPKDEYEASESSLCQERIDVTVTDVEESFAKLPCLLRKCSNCGVETLMRVLRAANADILLEGRQLKWKQWEVPENATSPVIVFHTGTLQELFKALAELLKKLPYHLFLKDWQFLQLRQAKKSITQGTVMQVMDFSQNFPNICQHEIQPAYWSRTQTTIHASINFYLCPNNNCKELVRHEVVHVSDDHVHDGHMVKACEDATLDVLRQSGIQVDRLIQFCDNARSQYKSKTPFVYLTETDIPKMRCYLGEGHGKGPADSCFGRTKQQVKHGIVSESVIITCAEDMWNYCSTNLEKTLEEGKCGDHYARTFKLILPVSHHFATEAKTVTGCSSFHQVQTVGQEQHFLSRKIACLCPDCLSGHPENCKYKAFVDDWKNEKVRFPGDPPLRKGTVFSSAFLTPEMSESCESESEEQASSESVIDVVDNCPRRTQRKVVSKKRGKTLHKTTQATVTDTGQKRGVKRKRSENASNVREQPSSNSVIDAVDDGDTEIRVPSDVNGQTSSESVSDAVDTVADTGRKLGKKDQQGKNSKRVLVKPMDTTGKENEPNPCPELEPVTDADCKVILDILYSLRMSYDKFEAYALSIDLSRFPSVDGPIQGKLERRHQIDTVAYEEFPDHLQRCVPVQITGDGNCFFRATSTLMYSFEEMHVLLRLLLVIEAVRNKRLYLDHAQLRKGAQVLYRRAELPTVYAQYSKYHNPEIDRDDITVEYIEFMYKKEVMSLAKVGSWAGVWQFHQMANVLKRPICSIYPERGECEFVKDLNRKFYPFDRRDTGRTPITIVWTGPEVGAAPNHFVAAMPN